ncbi:MAG: ABC transporter ATP-binding protein [Chitinispirillales bacterium]|nr:ABC transporter ATP-binding protein [Chitinispirillales bacterium]
MSFTAVKDLSFSLGYNRIAGFVGPNGAGKTTTIKMAMGLVKPTAGEISVMGVSSKLSGSRRGVAYVSEQPYFYKHLTVAETIDFSARLIGVKQGSLLSERKRALDAVELSGREKTKVHSLSKGLQQRLNMACGLLGDPKLLILDEPMSGLDPPSRRLFRNLFSRLGQEGRTVFFSTHVLDDIEAVCQDVVVLDSGALRFTGSVASLLEKGSLGTELIVPSIPENLAGDLREDGIELLRPLSGENISVMIPPQKDSAEYQRKLYEQGVYCLSVQKRTMPLEALLYGNSDQGGTAS